MHIALHKHVLLVLLSLAVRLSCSLYHSWAINDWLIDWYCTACTQTGLSHACASGFMPILELLATVADDVDPNLADNDGNTPLIYAAQAGQSCASLSLIIDPWWASYSYRVGQIKRRRCPENKPSTPRCQGRACSSRLFGNFGPNQRIGCVILLI